MVLCLVSLVSNLYTYGLPTGELCVYQKNWMQVRAVFVHPLEKALLKAILKL